jgi:hypothetical protein
MPTEKEITKQIAKIKSKYTEELQIIAEASGKRPIDIIRLARTLDNQMKILRDIAIRQLAEPELNTAQTKEKIALCRKIR